VTYVDPIDQLLWSLAIVNLLTFETTMDFNLKKISCTTYGV